MQCELESEFASHVKEKKLSSYITGWKVNDKWGNCTLYQEGWTHAEVFEGWKGPPFTFTGPNSETWSFYNYEQIFGSDEE